MNVNLILVHMNNVEATDKKEDESHSSHFELDFEFIAPPELTEYSQFYNTYCIVVLTCYFLFRSSVIGRSGALVSIL